ncbi:PAS domain-containing protein [Curvivirga aplysinae]|uniref:PAS domain-containing protein n=1 Tax=Curvivirga aplysinae TaxID=2529852 RepID=UPI0012BD4FF9|nr:PAS domain-containing protein [Curvivirga aplysinae]MTI08266.1 PAS domain-containing protein [Curvivirga aplysinae]
MNHTNVENFEDVSRVHIQSSDDFRSDQARELYEWWQSFTPKLPCRDDFKIEENWHIAPNLFLIECLGDGKFLYRLNGEEVRNLVGKNQAGSYFSLEGETPELVNLAKYLDGLRQIKKPIRCIGSLAFFGKTKKQFESLDCPLFDENGNVTFIIGIIVGL